MLIAAMPVIELRPGDVITNDESDVVVTGTEIIVGLDLVRVHGRISRGPGRSVRSQRWTYPRNQRLDVERGT